MEGTNSVLKYALTLRENTLRGLTKDEKAEYAAAARSNGPKFDYFKHAAGLECTAAAWKPFIVKLRREGRFFENIKKGESAESKMSAIMRRVHLMGQKITPVICYKLFPFAMSKAIGTECWNACNEVLAQIVAEEAKLKEDEMKKTIEETAGALKDQGISNPKIGITFVQLSDDK